MYLKIKIYFCDGHSPWQREANEAANGLIREFLSKDMDLSKISHQQINSIKHDLNHRPSKVLEFLSRYHVFSKLFSNLIAGVTHQT